MTQQNSDRTFAAEQAKFGYTVDKDKRDFAYRAGNDAAGRAVQLRAQDISASNARAAASQFGKPPPSYRYTATGDLEPIPGGPASMGKQLTETQAKATGLYRAASAAAQAMNDIKGYNPTLISGALDSNNTSATGLSQVDRRALNSQRAFANAVLRLESGAAISIPEINEKARVLFPAPGDGPDVLRDKANLRGQSLAALRDAAGPGARGLPRVVKAVEAAGTPRIRGNADYAKLPSGAVFIAPDGSRRVKP